MSSATIPLTTLFTPPASCSSISGILETYTRNRTEYHANLATDFGVKNLQCYPSLFEDVKYSQNTAGYYSPGICPIGYTSEEYPHSNADDDITAICCQSGFSTTEIKFDTSTVTSCYSYVYFDTDTASWLTVSVTNDDTSTLSTLSGEDIFAAPIQLRFKESQRDKLSSIKEGRTTLADSTQSVPDTATTPRSTSSTTPGPVDAPSRSKSKALPIALGVTLPLICLAALAAIILYLRRRKRRLRETNAYAPATMNGNGSNAWDTYGKPELAAGNDATPRPGDAYASENAKLPDVNIAKSPAEGEAPALVYYPAPDVHELDTSIPNSPATRSAISPSPFQPVEAADTSIAVTPTQMATPTNVATPTSEAAPTATAAAPISPTAPTDVAIPPQPQPTSPAAGTESTPTEAEVRAAELHKELQDLEEERERIKLERIQKRETEIREKLARLSSGNLVQ